MCNVSVFFSALYAKCPYDLLLRMQSVRILYCFVCKVSFCPEVGVEAGSGGRRSDARTTDVEGLLEDLSPHMAAEEQRESTSMLSLSGSSFRSSFVDS